MIFRARMLFCGLLVLCLLAGSPLSSLALAADAGHAEHGEAGEVNTSPLDFKTDLALWTFVVFVVLLIVLTKFAWGPIAEGLEKREHSIAENIAAAERLHNDAKTLIAQYEQKLADSANEVRKIIEEARRDGEHTMQELIAKGQSEVQLPRDRSIREIDTAKSQALKELSEASVNQAVNLAGRLIHAQLNADDHRKLIDESLASFPAQGKPGVN